MDAMKLVKEWTRLCESMPECCVCPVMCHVEKIPCNAVNGPESVYKMFKAVEAWAAENPQKTILEEFMEKYPGARINNRGIPPELCPDDLGYSKAEKCGTGNNICVKCWNRPLADETEA